MSTQTSEEIKIPTKNHNCQMETISTWRYVTIAWFHRVSHIFTVNMAEEIAIFTALRAFNKTNNKTKLTITVLLRQRFLSVKQRQQINCEHQLISFFSACCLLVFHTFFDVKQNCSKEKRNVINDFYHVIIKMKCYEKNNTKWLVVVLMMKEKKMFSWIVT